MGWMSVSRSMRSPTQPPDHVKQRNRPSVSGVPGPCEIGEDASGLVRWQSQLNAGHDFSFGLGRPQQHQSYRSFGANLDFTTSFLPRRKQQWRGAEASHSPTLHSLTAKTAAYRAPKSTMTAPTPFRTTCMGTWDRRPSIPLSTCRAAFVPLDQDRHHRLG